MRKVTLLYRDNAARCRRGHTLIELVASMTAATMLMTGMASALLISSSAFQMDAGSQAEKGVAAEIQADLTADLQHALSFSERTANAVTFTVPDRDGDFSHETIRYAWSGTLGDPLTYSYNGGTAVTLAGDVQRFNLSYLTRDMDADFIPPENILYVTKAPDVLNAEEQLRVTLMESLGYTVNLINDKDSQAVFDTAFSANHVVYVSMEMGNKDLGSKLADATIGVVNEHHNQRDDLGLARRKSDTMTQTIDIIDNTHYITSVFSTGTRTFATSAQQVAMLKPTLATGLQILGTTLDGSTPYPALATLDTGAERYGGGSSTSRRVQLPWGRGSFDFSTLNADGQTIFKRAIDWAGQQFTVSAGDEIQLFAYDVDAGNSSEFHIQGAKWIAEYFTPSLPPGATSWSITRVRFRVREDRDNTTLQLQIRPAGGSFKPTSTVLETVSIDWTDLLAYTDHEWYEINFSSVTGLDPTLGYCFVIKQAISPDDDHAARILVESSATAVDGHYVETSNSGGSWSDPSAGNDISLEVYGTFTK